MSDLPRARPGSDVVASRLDAAAAPVPGSAVGQETKRARRINDHTRTEHWVGPDGVRALLEQTQLGAPVGEKFQLRWSSTRLGDLAINRFDSDEIVIVRTTDMITKVPNALLHLNIVSSGHVRLTQRNRVAELGPGDAAFLFAGEPYRFEAIGRSTVVDLRVPLATFGDRASLILDQVAIRLMPTPLLVATVAFFDVLGTTLPPPTSTAAAYAERALLDLITAVLAERTDGSKATRGRREMRTRIHDFIRLRIDDPALTPHLIARHAGISREHLYRIFDADGITVGRFVRKLRLQSVARRLLADAPVTVAQLAAESGFSSADQLARLFRQAYGVAPTQYRKIGRA